MVDSPATAATPGRDVLIVTLTVVVAYALLLGGGFHYDDLHHVAGNPHIRSLENIPTFFTDSGTFSSIKHHRLYRPVLMTTYALDWAVWGNRAGGFLFTNLLLHLAAALAVLALARELLGTRRAALFAAVLFAVHPVASEVVNYVSARSSSLATLFCVLAVLAHLRADRERGAKAIRFRLVSYAMLVLGLLSKEFAVTVPVLAFLASLARDSREERFCGIRRRLLAVAPMFAIAFVWYYFLYSVQVAPIASSLARRLTSKPGANLLVREQRGVLENLATQSRVFWMYASIVLLPIGLTADRFVRMSAGFLSDPAALAALLSIVALLVLVVRSRLPSLWFGVFWFGVALLPTSVKPLMVIMNEHRMYLPMVGIVMPLGALLAWLWDRGRLRWAAVAACVLLGLVTLDRTRDWRLDEDELDPYLWQTAIDESPRSYQAHTNLGIVHYRRFASGSGKGGAPDIGLLDAALAEYEIGESLNPDWFNIPFNQGLAHLALAFATQDDMAYDAATERFERCLEIIPGSARARWWLAKVAFAQGRHEKALAAFRAMRAADDSDTAMYHAPIAQLQTRLMRWAKALETFDELFVILERKGLRAAYDVHVDHARALEGIGRTDEAEAVLQQMVKTHGGSLLPLADLGKFYRRTAPARMPEVENIIHMRMMRRRPTHAEQKALDEMRKIEASGASRGPGDDPGG
jgi:protein O-mannosyl-transferase